MNFNTAKTKKEETKEVLQPKNFLFQKEYFG